MRNSGFQRERVFKLMHLQDRNNSTTVKPTAIILIVDDDETSRLSVQRLLEREGYRILSAENGEEGLKLALEFQPDMILTDVAMPDMDGYELCRRIREQEKLAEIPVLMMTAFDDQDSRVRGVEAGADDFLSKPVSPNFLKARVKTCLLYTSPSPRDRQKSRMPSSA